MAVRTPEASQKELKRKLSRVVRILEERYGPHIFPEERALLDQLLFAILVTENPVTNARKALRELKEEYVDWNEVRVSSLRTLEETFERARIEPASKYAEILKGLLERSFQELCRLDLDVLKTEGPERARKLAARLDMLRPAEQQYLLVAAGVETAPPLDPATERICERIGIFRSEDPPAKRRRALEAVIQAGDALRFHHLMVEHGKKLCTVGDPKCAKCLVQSECEFFRREAGAARRKSSGGASRRPSAAPGARTDGPPKRASRGAARGQGARRAGGEEDE